MKEPSTEHYLKKELYALVRTDPQIFEFLQAGSLDGIWYWDAENPAEEWLSPRFKEVFGYTDDEISNTSQWWQDNIHPDDLKVALDNFKKHCKDPTHPYDQVVRYRHKDGSTVWVRCRGIAIRNSQGKATRLLGAHSDVTALKNAEEELDRKNAELESKNAELTRLNHELDAFTYSVSHDLRAPLRAIRGYSQFLEKDYGKVLDAEGLRLLGVVRSGTEEMSQLIEDLLSFSRIGRAPIKSVQVDMSRLACDAYGKLIANDSSKRVECKIDDLPPVKGDPSLLAQVFTNLIGNALKFSRACPHPRIEIGGESDGEFRVYRVKDNGIGFDMKYAHKLFGVFQRLHSSETAEGTGVGLAIVQRIIERHGGAVWAESKPSEGSIFSFRLPAEGSSP